MPNGNLFNSYKAPTLNNKLENNLYYIFLEAYYDVGLCGDTYTFETVQISTVTNNIA